MLTAVAAPIVLALAAVSDPVPDDDDVVAGWGAFALFGLLVLAVVILGVSLTRRLKNADRAEAQGLYDPSPKAQREQARRAGWPTVEASSGAEPTPGPSDPASDRPQEK